MPLSGMLADVTQVKVASLLNQRRPDILDASIPEEVALFEATVESASVELLFLVNEDPPSGAIRRLAVEAIALETASLIEYAQYPEQQAPGETGRGYHLHQRYLELLGRVRELVNAAGGVVPADGGTPVLLQGGRPRARFPEPMGYPDPVERRR